MPMRHTLVLVRLVPNCGYQYKLIFYNDLIFSYHTLSNKTGILFWEGRMKLKKILPELLLKANHREQFTCLQPAHWLFQAETSFNPFKATAKWAAVFGCYSAKSFCAFGSSERIKNRTLPLLNASWRREREAEPLAAITASPCFYSSAEIRLSAYDTHPCFGRLIFWKRCMWYASKYSIVSFPLFSNCPFIFCCILFKSCVLIPLWRELRYSVMTYLTWTRNLSPLSCHYCCTNCMSYIIIHIARAQLVWGLPKALQNKNVLEFPVRRKVLHLFYKFGKLKPRINNFQISGRDCLEDALHCPYVRGW